MEPNSLSFQEEVRSSVESMGFNLLRYPGGTLSDTYFWREGISPTFAGRGKCQNAYTPDVNETVNCGTPEFLSLVDAAGAAPMITANIATDTAAEARAWFEYLDREDVWVEIGNEPYLLTSAIPVNHPPGEVGRIISEFAAELRAVGRPLRLGAPLRYAEMNGVEMTAWSGAYDREMLSNLTEHMDFFAVHSGYVPLFLTAPFPINDTELLYWGLMAGVTAVVSDLDNTRADIVAYAPASTHNSPFFMTEWSTLFGIGTIDDLFLPWSLSSSTMAGLYVADLMHAMSRRTDMAGMAYWSASGQGFFGAVDGASGAFRPQAFVLRELRASVLAAGGEVVPTRSAAAVPSMSWVAPAFQLVASADVPLLSWLAALHGGALRVSLLNKSLNETAVVHFGVDGAPFAIDPGTPVSFRTFGDEGEPTESWFINSTCACFEGKPALAAGYANGSGFLAQGADTFTVNVPPHTHMVVEVNVRRLGSQSSPSAAHESVFF